MRLFIAIDFPEDVKKEIEKIQKKLPQFQGKLTERENLHLTLKFLGEVDDSLVEDIKKRLNKIKLKKFDVEVDSLGYFSPSVIKIVWLHVAGCEKIQKEIDEKLEELFAKEKGFMSHLTIARVKSPGDKLRFIKELVGMKFDRIKVNISSFKLKSSTLTPEGPIYKDVLEVKLS